MFELPSYFVGLFGYKIFTGVDVLFKSLAVGGVVYGVSKVPAIIGTNRHKMTKAFMAAQIGIKVKKTDFNGKSYEILKMPKIMRISKTGNELRVAFRLPIGLNPSELEKKEFVFRQLFGENARLVKNSELYYTMIVDNALSSMIPYDFVSVRKEFKRIKGLPVFAGFNREGKAIAYDMKMKPHLGIVGVTGFGKSSFLRVLLCSWLQYFSSDELELYMGDLKKTEFGGYSNIPHVKQIAITKSETLRMLQKVSSIIDDRGKLLNKLGATNIDQYKKKTGKHLSYVVVCVDEVALLSKEKNIHEILEEIGAVGRALGVFLILSQQRADAEIISGRLKNNLTVRIAFRMSDALNSRMFLDSDIASTLEVAGRCIVKEPDQMNEVQTPWLDEEEAEEILSRYKSDSPKFGSETLVYHEQEPEEIIYGELG